MFKLFESRNRKMTDLVKLGDYLGRSLRTNTHLFSVDSEFNKVVYLSEDNQLIQGTYTISGPRFVLENIEIEDASVFTDDEQFDSYLDKQTALFIGDIYNDNLDEAKSNFDNVLDLWQSRARYNSTSQKLQAKRQSFNNTNNIVETTEFKRFFEVMPELSKHLAENLEISQIPEISNSVKLSEAVAKAFNIPHLTYDELSEVGRFEFNNTEDTSIYDIVCRQELIRKEILEAKDAFELVWANEPCVSNLTKTIYGDDEEVVAALNETIKELPYICLVSKKKLTETVVNNLGDYSDEIPAKDIKAFVGKLFELKKPAKKQLTNLLYETYGINLQYIKEIPTFKSLLNTQVVIFETLARTAPRGSVLKSVLSETATLLKSKNGVEALDVNSILHQLFEYVNYSFEEIPLFERFSFDEISSEFKKLDTIVEGCSGDDSEGDEESVLQHEDEGEKKTSKKKKKSSDKKKQDDTRDVQQEELEEEEDTESDSEDEPDEDTPTNSMSDKNLMAAIAELEKVFNTDNPIDKEEK